MARQLARLRRGSHSLSLPACYLCEEGVPALYATAKLENRQYIFQRVYETGLFADDVLDVGGFQVLEDYTPELYLEVLKDVDPEGGWTSAHGGKLARAGGEASPGLAARVQEEAKKRRKRFLWGRGFLAARKVRFLHASIRFMLQNPDKLPHRPAEAHAGSGGESTGRPSSATTSGSSGAVDPSGTSDCGTTRPSTRSSWPWCSSPSAT